MSTAPQFASSYRKTITQWVNAGAPAQCVWRAGPNGSRISSMVATQDDTTTATMTVYTGLVLTDNAKASPFLPPDIIAACPVLALTNTTNSTITRTNGRFIQDGWSLNKMLCVLNSWDNPANQTIAHPTTIAAATLTFTGTVFNAAAATPSANLQLAQVAPQWAVPLVSGCGMTTVPAVDMMSTTNNPSFFAVPNRFLLLGPNQVLVINCGTLPAVNKSINVVVEGADW